MKTKTLNGVNIYRAQDIAKFLNCSKQEVYYGFEQYWEILDDKNYITEEGVRHISNVLSNKSLLQECGLSNVGTDLSVQKTMTLKEITDLLEVRHSNAKRVVEAMSKNTDFGTTAQIELLLKVNNGGSKRITSYLLNKRQSIAVSAKLNTTLLMRIIDRWQELEKLVETPQFNIPKTLSEALLLAGKLAAENEFLVNEQQVNAPKVAFHATVTDSEGYMNIGEAAKLLGYGRTKLFSLLRLEGLLMSDNTPYQRYVDFDYFTRVVELINGKPVNVTKVSNKGLYHIHSVLGTGPNKKVFSVGTTVSKTLNAASHSTH